MSLQNTLVGMVLCSFFVFTSSKNATNGNFKDKSWVLYMHLSSKQTMTYRPETKNQCELLTQIKYCELFHHSTNQKAKEPAGAIAHSRSDTFKNKCYGEPNG